MVLIAQIYSAEGGNYFLPADNFVAALVAKVIAHVFTNKFLFAFCCCMSSYLLIAEIPLLAFKFKNFSWADNKLRYIFLGISLSLILWLWLAAIPLIIILYILLSLVKSH